MMNLRCMFSLTASLALFSSFCAPTSAQEPSPATVSHGIVFLPLEFYSEHSAELGLNDDQRHEINRILEEFRDVAPKFASQVNDRATALQKAVAQHPVDIDVAMDRFNALMEAESDMKSLQFKVHIKMRSVLRPEQFETVKAIVSKAQVASNVSEQDEAKRKFMKLQMALKNATEPEQQEQIEQQMKKLKEQYAADTAASKGHKTTFGSSSRSHEEVREQIRRVAEFAERADTPEIRDQLNQAVQKLKEAEAAENYEVIIDILGAVKKLVQQQ